MGSFELFVIVSFMSVDSYRSINVLQPVLHLYELISGPFIGSARRQQPALNQIIIFGASTADPAVKSEPIKPPASFLQYPYVFNVYVKETKRFVSDFFP